jgi:hypothetical protein
MVLARASAAEAAPPNPREEVIAQANRAAEDRRLDESRRHWRTIWDTDASTLAACNVGELSSRMEDLLTAERFLSLCVERGVQEESHRLELAKVRRQLGHVRLKRPDGALVSLDGRELEPGKNETWVLPGHHVLSARRGDRRVEVAVSVAAGEERSVTLELPVERAAARRRAERPARTEGPRWPIYAGAVGAGAAAIAGGVTLALALVARDTAVSGARQVGPNGCFERLPGCDEVRTESERFFTYRTVAVSLLVGAGVLGAGTAVYAIVRPTGVAVAGQW